MPCYAVEEVNYAVGAFNGTPGLTGTNAGDTVVANGNHVRYSPQATYFMGPFGVMAASRSPGEQKLNFRQRRLPRAV